MNKLLAERKNNKNKEISRSGLLLPVKYLRNGKRYSSSVFFFGQLQESRYQTVQPATLYLLSFQRYEVVSIMIFEC